MHLSQINNYSKQYVYCINISEGYGRRFAFDYQGDQVTDPRPNALSLGQWKSGRGNNLMAGINLNYLSPEQVTRLQQNLQPILKDRNLKRRVRTLRHLMPDIFNSAYRTYYKDAVNNVDPGTLKFAKIPKDPTPEVPQPEYDPNATTKKSEFDVPSGIDLTKDVSDRKTEKEPVKPEPEPVAPDKLDQPEKEQEEPEYEDIGSDEIDVEDPEDEEEEV